MAVPSWQPREVATTLHNTKVYGGNGPHLHCAMAFFLVILGLFDCLLAFSTVDGDTTQRMPNREETPGNE